MPDLLNEHCRECDKPILVAPYSPWDGDERRLTW